MSTNVNRSENSSVKPSVPALHSQLMEAVAENQDTAAFAELFAHYTPRLRAYLIRTGATGGVVEELVQEVMLTAWRKAALYKRAQGGVSTWLYTIARNAFIDHVRREKRPTYDSDDPLLNIASDEDPEHDVNTKLNAVALRTAIKGLSEEQMKVILLFYFAHKTHTEIAEELNLPLGTVKSRVRLAVEHLRHALSDRIDS